LPTLLFLFCSPCPAATAEEANPPAAEEEARPHLDPSALRTEDEVLREQIVKVNDALEELHQEIAQQRKKIQAAGTDAERAGLYARLDALHKEHDMLERLLHELVEEAKVTEWTELDEAISRAEDLRRQREYQELKRELLRDRQE